MKTKHTSARLTALRVLEEVFEQGAYSNLALKKALSQSRLSQADKGLTTELVYGTVARKITLEWYLSHLIEDRNQLDSWLYSLLLLSLYQLLYLDKIPSHAAVHEAAEIAKTRKRGSEKLVNAILRRIEREGVADVSRIKRKNKRFSIQYSLPVWLVKAMIEEYGEVRAEAIFASLFTRSKASIRVADLSRKAEVKELLGAEDSLLAPSALVKKQGNFAGHTLFSQGLITIQDESSQLVAPILQIEGDEDILDACSAPGGKAVHMASYLTSGCITALDLYDHKLQLIEENARRLGAADKITTQKLDARKVFETFGPRAFDKILVDAPCSGIGLIRRKPDIKYNKENADFKTLQKIQLDILDSVCQSLRKGGIIAYSTCTIMSQENFEVVKKFLDSHPDFEQVILDHERKDIVKDGCILITPELYGSDGFFISQFRKVSE
ncbi:Ribosomal RNA small subunit methyltransferase B [Streptococcus sp. DD11]|uniref:16S rRNA (cytosine(967)-C(5))-methyltransferase RsmB n=1 Tax=Streptococcus sp. DD11 TaxID=1777879 RepID=UPI00079518B2|nr:16S rRNA (cytosine(967)-C(5))-methyltransferase RsmB [Streptococcus sp. DD11]KXT86172.1 Ribosomal RNA small subunit methyltransferase B [Streptococcus sp. DD11]